MKDTILMLVSLLLVTSCGNGQNDSKEKGFSKIIFHTSECFGTCPTYHLQVDSDRSLKLYAERVYKQDNPFNYEIDTSRIGYFKGNVDDTTFAKLIQELEAIDLETLQFDGATCCDGSVKTIIIYYDGKRKYLQSMFPPDKADNLINLLRDICSNSPVYRSINTFEIEK